MKDGDFVDSENVVLCRGMLDSTVTLALLPPLHGELAVGLPPECRFRQWPEDLGGGGCWQHANRRHSPT